MIKTDLYKFSQLSMMDDFGRIFYYNGGIYRGILKSKSDLCKTLLNSSLFKELSQQGLIPKTEISDLQIKNYGLVLSHEKLLETLQHEWSFNMLRDAALTVLKVNQICNNHGYELKDAHAFNLLFRGTQPVWVDIGSIIPRAENSKNWRAYEEFLKAFVIPLLFWSDNKHFIARKLLESIYHGLTTIPGGTIEHSGLLELLKITKQPFILKYKSRNLIKTRKKLYIISFIISKLNTVLKKITGKNVEFLKYALKSNFKNNISNLLTLNEAKTTLENLGAPTTKSQWGGYHQNYYNPDGTTTYSHRFIKIFNLIKSEPSIKTIIDLAGNEGYFTSLLDTYSGFDKLILSDYDENAVDKAYIDFKATNSDKVTPLLLNFMYTPNISNTAKRLKSDLAIALAVTHHLILSANYSLSAIFERIKQYSNNFVMIEFMPLGLWSTNDKELPAIPDWYNELWFKEEFELYFTLISQEKLEQNRILFYGKVKQ